jgi:hypothetical protein
MTKHEKNKRRGLLVRRQMAYLAAHGLVDPPHRRRRAKTVESDDETTERAGWDDLMENLPDAG